MNLSEEERSEIIRQLKELVALGHVRPSTSPMAAAVFLVRQRDKWRMVFDYRQLNKNTIPQVAVMPRNEGIEARTAEAEIFSKGDYKSSYNQIPVRPGDEWKTAFASPMGLLEWRVMPFGLRNAPAHMQRIIERVVDLRDSEKFIDDWLLFDRTNGKGMDAVLDMVNRHAARIRTVLLRSRDENLKLKRGKEEWFKEEIDFLGITMKAGGRIKPTKDSLETIRKMEPPTSLESLYSFIGSIGWLRKFIVGLNLTLVPLQQLLTTALQLEREAKVRVGKTMKGARGTKASAHLFPLKEHSREMLSFREAVNGLLNAAD